MAGVQGFEPRYQESKSCVLPLDDTPIIILFRPDLELVQLYLKSI